MESIKDERRKGNPNPKEGKKKKICKK